MVVTMNISVLITQVELMIMEEHLKFLVKLVQIMKLLKYYLYKYLYGNGIEETGHKLYEVKASNNPYKFEFDLREDNYVKKQLQETALLSYLLYEDGKIVIDEITPKDRFGDMFVESSRHGSASLGKSIVSYVTGHAICAGYIDSVDSKLDDGH